MNPAPQGSSLTFKLSLRAGGLSGPMVNAVMAPLLRPAATSLADKIGARLQDVPPGA